MGMEKIVVSPTLKVGGNLYTHKGGRTVGSGVVIECHEYFLNKQLPAARMGGGIDLRSSILPVLK